jgi:hypothetical protein
MQTRRGSTHARAEESANGRVAAVVVRRVALKVGRRARAARRASARLLRAMLAVSLLASSTPATPPVVASALSELRLGASLWLLSDAKLPRALAWLGGSGGPRAARQETQDDRDAHKQREYDYDASLLRRTRRTYLDALANGYSTTGFNWDHFQNDRFKPYLTGLVSSTSVYSGTTDDTIVSRAEYSYDEDPNPLNIPPGPPCFGCSYTYQGRLANTPGVVQHSDTFDPYRGPIFPWSTVPGSG